MSRKPLVAGNWKMNLDHLQAIANVQKICWILKDADHDPNQVEVVVMPPFTDLRSVQTLVDAEKFDLTLGAQDVSAREKPGAYTGEIAASFLAKLSVKYVLVGHSERRQYHGEDDQLVAAKVAAIRKQGMIPMLCVGETDEDRQTHGSSAVPVRQLLAALSGSQPFEIVIAYEPVWAIGSGKAATPEEAQITIAALREALAGAWTDGAAQSTRILYGGSVGPENVAGFMKQPDIDGVLVGGASIDPEKFTGIVRFPKHLAL